MFTDRKTAGDLLASKLQSELDISKSQEFVILSIPRGGVVVGSSIAERLQLKKDVILTKKLSAPNRPELAIGAVGETEGSLYLDDRIIEELKISQQYVYSEIEKKQNEIAEREETYRSKRAEILLKDRRVILVDDGAATGATLVAASREVWNRQPKQVIIAIPVCAKHTLQLLEQEADMVVVLEVPDDFYAVEQFYEEFPQISDEEVIRSLSQEH